MRNMLFLGLMILLILGLSAEGEAEEIFEGPVFADVIEVLDGDTISVSASVWLEQDIMTHVRLLGVDTPEIKGKCQKEKELARKAKQITVNFLRTSKIIELRNVKRGKYFRIVADVFGDNISLTETLINSGYAVPYYGNKKTKNWCL